MHPFIHKGYTRVFAYIQTLKQLQLLGTFSINRESGLVSYGAFGLYTLIFLSDYLLDDFSRVYDLYRVNI